MPKCIPSPAVKIRHRISCKSILRFSITELVKYCGSPTYTLNKKVIGEQGPQDTLQTSSASIPGGFFFLLSCLVAALLLLWPDPLPHTKHQQRFVIYLHQCRDKTWSLKLCVGENRLLLKQKMYLGNKHKEQLTPIHWNEGYISKYLQKKKIELQVLRFFNNTESFSKQNTFDYFFYPKK